MTALPQCMQALGRANEVRLTNANFRRTVAAKPPREAAELVAYTVEHEHDDDSYGALATDRLLRFIPHLGQQKVTKCLMAAGVVNQSKRLRDLTPRQRAAVAAQVRLWAAGYRS